MLSRECSSRDCSQMLSSAVNLADRFKNFCVLSAAHSHYTALSRHTARDPAPRDIFTPRDLPYHA